MSDSVHHSFVLIVLFSLVVFSSANAVPRVVVAEEFTGTWCTYCPSAMMGLHNLYTDVGDNIAPIAYHKQDSFTVPGYWDRANLYGVGGIPDVWFDGVLRRLGGHHTNPVNNTSYYNTRRAVDSPLSMQITLEDYDQNAGIGHVTVDVLNETATRDDVIGCVHLMVTGDDTLFYWQGQSRLYFTALQIDFGDDTCLIFEPGISFQATGQEFQIPEGWRQKSCTIVGLVQNPETNEIYQGAVLHGITSTFSGSVDDGRIKLTWGPVDVATEYWVYGASNEYSFMPGFSPDYTNRLAVIPHGTEGYATTDGINDPESNWTYMVISVDAQERERYRTHRFGAFGYGVTIP